MDSFGYRRQSLNVGSLKSSKKTPKRRKTSNLESFLRKNDDQIPKFKQFEESKNKLISDMKTLFIPESNYRKYISMIEYASNENDLEYWKSFIDSFSKYLNSSIDSRCLVYINEQIFQCKTKINNAHNKVMNKRAELTFQKITKDLDHLYSLLNQPGNGKMAKISGLKSIFDRFYNALANNYISFFQNATHDLPSMNKLLKTAKKPIQNIILCSQSIMKLDEIQNMFLTQMDQTTELFEKALEKSLNKGQSNPFNNINESYYSKIINSNKLLIEKKLSKAHKSNREKSIFLSQPNFQNGPMYHLAGNKNSKKIKFRNINLKDGEQNDHEKMNYYPISKKNLSDSDDDFNIPSKPKKFKLTQARYNQLNKKFSINPNNTNVADEYSSAVNPSTTTSTSSNTFNINDENNDNLIINSTNIANITNNAIRHPKYKSINKSNQSSRSFDKKFPKKPKLNNIPQKNNSNYENQMIEKRNEEEKLSNMLQIIEHRNDEIREKHKILKNSIDKNPKYIQIKKLKNEIEILKSTLEKLSTSYDDMILDVDKTHNLIDIYKTTVNNMTDEYEQIIRINSGIKIEDETANFTNPELKKSCEYLKNELDKTISFAQENQIQKQELINSLDLFLQQSLFNEEAKNTYNMVTILSNVIHDENKILEIRYDNFCSSSQVLHQRPSSPYLKRYLFSQQKLPNRYINNNKTSKDSENLKNNISNLEQKIKEYKNTKDQNKSFSSLKQHFNSMKYNTTLMKNEIKKLQMENHNLMTKIQRLNNLNNISSARKDFDEYEQLRISSRELLVKYFSVQKQKNDSLNAPAKYSIEMELDDIQEQYTLIMMEIERIGNTKAQESLHEKRKIKIKGRKSGARLLDTLSEAAKANIDAERRVSALENSNKLTIKDEERLANLTEVIFEYKKTKELLSVINEKSNQLLKGISGSDFNGKDNNVIHSLTNVVTQLIRKGGKIAETKMRIFNLKQELNSYSSLS